MLRRCDVAEVCHLQGSCQGGSCRKEAATNLPGMNPFEKQTDVKNRLKMTEDISRITPTLLQIVDKMVCIHPQIFGHCKMFNHVFFLIYCLCLAVQDGGS